MGWWKFLSPRAKTIAWGFSRPTVTPVAALKNLDQLPHRQGLSHAVFAKGQGERWQPPGLPTKPPSVAKCARSRVLARVRGDPSTAPRTNQSKSSSFHRPGDVGGSRDCASLSKHAPGCRSGPSSASDCAWLALVSKRRVSSLAAFQPTRSASVSFSVVNPLRLA